VTASVKAKSGNSSGECSVATATASTDKDPAVCVDCVSKRLMDLINKRIQEEGSAWPLDFRPQGFESAKFEYDGT